MQLSGFFVQSIFNLLTLRVTSFSFLVTIISPLNYNQSH